MISSKGGVGKTTASLLLAGEIARAGKSVGLIDSDPNFPLVRWSKRANRSLSAIAVYGDADDDSIIETIEASAQRHDFTIVDLEGTANARITYAVSQSQLTLIPLQGSALDAEEAAKSIRLIRSLEKVSRRVVPYRVFFSRVPAAIRERTLINLETQFRDAEIPLLPVSVIDRAAYRALFSFGETLDELDPTQVSGLEQAKTNTTAFAQAVLDVLKEGRPG